MKQDAKKAEILKDKNYNNQSFKKVIEQELE
jgi:hypothetical protein